MTSARACGLVIALACAGCTVSVPAFHCATDGDCDAGGRCLGGACAKSDASCGTGWRWDDSAGDRANACVTLAGSDGGDPNCGNGLLDPGETCDPGPGTPAPCPTSADCDNGNPCFTNRVVGSPCHEACSHDTRDAGVACTLDSDGGVRSGVCEIFSCCTGCWTGSACNMLASPMACGAGGGACVDCTAGLGECRVAGCVGGACRVGNAGDGSPCASGAGQCLGGACCTGCVQGGACQTGSSATACGSGGGACVACPSGASCVSQSGGYRCSGCVPACTGKSCGPDGCGGQCGAPCPSGTSCNNGQCGCTASASSESSDALCSDQLDDDCNGLTDCADAACNDRRCAQAVGRFCVGGMCMPTGCLIAGATSQLLWYQPGATDPSDGCHVCDPSVSDTAWTPIADGMPCAQGGQQGTCVSQACCTTCVSGSTCVAASALGPSQCGQGGGVCQQCPAGADVCSAMAVCNAGVCGTQAAPDGTLCSPSTCGSCGGCSGACVIGYGCSRGVCSSSVTGSQCCPAKCCVNIDGSPFCGSFCPV